MMLDTVDFPMRKDALIVRKESPVAKYLQKTTILKTFNNNLYN